MAAEARLGDEHHFLCFGKTNALAEDGEVQQLDAAEKRGVGVNQKPERGAAVSIYETKQS